MQIGEILNIFSQTRGRCGIQYVSSVSDTLPIDLDGTSSDLAQSRHFIDKEEEEDIFVIRQLYINVRNASWS